MDLDKIFESSRYGECKVVSYKGLIKKGSSMSESSINSNGNFTDEQEVLFNDFKAELIKRMQPVVENLVEYLRALEKTSKGEGYEEINKMLDAGDINEPMFKILIDSLVDLENDYVVNLIDNKYFNNNNK